MREEGFKIIVKLNPIDYLQPIDVNYYFLDCVEFCCLFFGGTTSDKEINGAIESESGITTDKDRERMVVFLKQYPFFHSVQFSENFDLDTCGDDVIFREPIILNE